jgi:hypothetical protein
MKTPARSSILLLSLCQLVVPSISAQPVGLELTIPAKLSTSVEGFLLVPVTINGKRFWCDLDSGGSSVLSLDEKKAAAAGFRADETGTSAGAGPTVIRDQRLHGATVQVGGLALPPRTIVMRRFPAEVPEMDCVMGASLLQDYVVQFDYVTPAVRLLDPTSFKRDPNAFSIAFRMERSNPIADITFVLDDSRRVLASVILDTGAAFYSAALTSTFINKELLKPALTRTARPAERSNDGLSVLAARPVRIEAGPVRLAFPVIALIESESAGLPLDGVLGAGFFRRFTATFDYTRRELLLTPNAGFSDEHLFDASGLGFRKDAESGNLIVNLVLPESPAAMADLREGDVLLTIDGARGETLTPVDARKRLSGSDALCVLTISRNGVRHLIQLQLRKRL